MLFVARTRSFPLGAGVAPRPQAENKNRAIASKVMNLNLVFICLLFDKDIRFQ
jgi:hypothetical protein